MILFYIENAYVRGYYSKLLYMRQILLLTQLRILCYFVFQ